MAEWALSSWTALLISRGVDNFAPAAAAIHHHHYYHGHGRDGSVASIEKQFAHLLSNREQSTSSHNNPAVVLANAVASRIDELLFPSAMSATNSSRNSENGGNLTTLNGINIYSLGRLLASFHLREQAEGHIITSICNCAMLGGMVGLEQLSCLLAVYACCIPAATTAELQRNSNVGSNTPSSGGRTSVDDVEVRLRAKLDDDEFIERITLEIGGKQHLALVKQRSKSFLDVVLCATAHLVQST